LIVSGRRRSVVKRFQEDPDIAAFLLHTKSQAAGLNLTVARYVFLVEPLLHPSAREGLHEEAERFLPVGKDDDLGVRIATADVPVERVRVSIRACSKENRRSTPLRSTSTRTVSSTRSPSRRRCCPRWMNRCARRSPRSRRQRRSRPRATLSSSTLSESGRASPVLFTARPDAYSHPLHRPARRTRARYRASRCTSEVLRPPTVAG
jgi:hypothetical protein